MVKKLLTVKPEFRPDCDQILLMAEVDPWIKKFWPKIADKIIGSKMKRPEDEIMLKTIKMPKKVEVLEGRLPEDQYDLGTPIDEEDYEESVYVEAKPDKNEKKEKELEFEETKKEEKPKKPKA